MGSVDPVVWELWPVDIEKRMIFMFFFRFASDWPNLWEILTILEVANLKINDRATFGPKMGSVAPAVWELWPIKIKKGNFLQFFSILHKIIQT